MTDFKLGELNEELLVKGTFAKLSQRSLVIQPSASMASLMLFKVGCFDVARGGRIVVDEALENISALVDGTLPLLKLQKGIPCVLGRLPSHPVLKHTPRPFGLPKHLLHQSILVPELVDARQVLTGTFPHIAS